MIGPAVYCEGVSCASDCTGISCGRALLPLLISRGRVRVTLQPRQSIESKAMRYGVAGTSLMVGTYYVEASVRLTRARKHDSQAFVEGQWFVRWCVPHDIDGPAESCEGESCASACDGEYCGGALFPLLISHARVRVTLQPRRWIASRARRCGVAGTSLMVGTYACGSECGFRKDSQVRFSRLC